MILVFLAYFLIPEILNFSLLVMMLYRSIRTAIIFMAIPNSLATLVYFTKQYVIAHIAINTKESDDMKIIACFDDIPVFSFHSVNGETLER